MKAAAQQTKPPRCPQNSCFKREKKTRWLQATEGIEFRSSGWLGKIVRKKGIDTKQPISSGRQEKSCGNGTRELEGH